MTFDITKDPIANITNHPITSGSKKPVTNHPIAPAELKRLNTLCKYSILDTEPEKAFDDLTNLAATLCQTPIALVSLVDCHRQWFKSKVGLDASETPRNVAFCAYVVQQAQMLIVPDTLEDPRFATNPLVVGDPYIRFYAGAPLITPEGEVLGTLCVIDVVPRVLTSEQIQALEVLSHQVMAQLELRRKLYEADVLMEKAHEREHSLRQEVQERQRAEAKLAAKTQTMDRFNAHLKQLHCLSTSDYSSFEALCADYLQVGRQILGCQTGIISQIEGQTYTVKAVQSPLDCLRSHDTFDLADTYCAEVIRQASTITYTHVGKMETVKGHPCYQNLGLETYIATAIWVNGAIYGTLNFSSAQVRGHQFTAQDKEILELMAASIGKFIAMNQAEAQIRQQAQALRTTLDELKEAQSHMVQQAKTSSLGILAGGVAHEINNPINFINGNLNYLHKTFDNLAEFITLYQKQSADSGELLQQCFADLDWEFVRQDLPNLFDSIHLGVGRVKETVSALQTFARLDEAGLKTVNLHHSLDNTLLLLRHRLNDPSSGCSTIQVLQHYEALPRIEAYPGTLNQVLMNLMNNAIDAIAHRYQQQTLRGDPAHPGKIGVRTRQLGEEWVEIAIADNGSGIDPAIQAHIFDPFFTTKPVGTGAGLGLSISYRLVEQHGGKIHYCSSDEGSEFVIKLPIQQRDK